jgi:UPF0755 protein
MSRDLPSSSEILRRLARLLFSVAAAAIITVVFLFAAYRLLVAPARGNSLAARSGHTTRVEGGLRGLAIRLYLEANAAALEAETANADTASVTFEVAAGETASDVATRLVEANLVRNATAFRMLMRYYGIDRNIEAGRFQLSPAMSAEAIARALMSSSADETGLVSLEGWRMEQTGDAVALAFGEGDEFLRIAGSEASTLLPDWVRAPAGTLSVEGFLFPNTYRFSPDASGADIVGAMLEEFASQFGEASRQRAAQIGITPYEVVTLASIVEREAVAPDERPLIAAAFLNRVKLGMRLEADPTVQYALGRQADTGRWWKVPLLGADITDTVSPYNTYLTAGLPPGPICSPGRASIEAVLWPADVDYLYFVAKGDGSHAFTASFDEHLANVARYQGG